MTLNWCSCSPGFLAGVSVCCASWVFCGIVYFLSAAAACGGASNFLLMCMASRTCSMVFSAAASALREPASRISHAALGFASYCRRRSWIGASLAMSESAAQPLHSMHPMPALRQPSYTLVSVSLLEKILCRSPTGHLSGSPGSVRRTRAGSVTMVFSLARMLSGRSLSWMVLLYDFDILRPSVPGSLGDDVSRFCGSGKTYEFSAASCETPAPESDASRSGVMMRPLCAEGVFTSYLRLGGSG